MNSNHHNPQQCKLRSHFRSTNFLWVDDLILGRRIFLGRQQLKCRRIFMGRRSHFGPTKFLRSTDFLWVDNSLKVDDFFWVDDLILGRRNFWVDEIFGSTKNFPKMKNEKRKKNNKFYLISVKMANSTYFPSKSLILLTFRRKS